MAACAGLPLGIVTECFGEWKYLLRPGAGAWARGPAAVGVAELGGDTGPPEATGAGGPRAAERFTSGRRGPCEGAVPRAEPEWLSSESLPGTVLDVLPGQRGELQVKPEPASYPSPT
jgi:hypothetical protein